MSIRAQALFGARAEEPLILVDDAGVELGTVTLADGTVIHSSMAPALPPRSTLPPAPAGDLLGFS